MPMWKQELGRLCPPEGDAGTGIATRPSTVAVRTGKRIRRYSVFAMIVLEKALKNVHAEMDLRSAPSGEAGAMAHCNELASESGSP